MLAGSGSTATTASWSLSVRIRFRRALDIVVFRDDRIGDLRWRHARRIGRAQSRRAATSLHQQSIGVAVITTGELNQFATIGISAHRPTARGAQGAHHGFGARIDHAHHLHRRHDFAHHARHLDFELGRRAIRCAALQLGAHRVVDDGRRVPVKSAAPTSTRNRYSGYHRRPTCARPARAR